VVLFIRPDSGLGPARVGPGLFDPWAGPALNITGYGSTLLQTVMT
jgi:hypothetical protein